LCHKSGLGVKGVDVGLPVFEFDVVEFLLPQSVGFDARLEVLLVDDGFLDDEVV